MSPAAEPTDDGKVDGRTHLGVPGQLWSRQFYTGVLASNDGPYVRRVLITIGLIAFAYTLWLVGRVLLLAFGAILIAVLFNGLAAVIARRTPVPERWSLAVGILTTAVLFVGFFAVFGAQLGEQVRQVIEQLPAATDAVGERFGTPNVTQRLEDAVAAGANTNVMSGMYREFSAKQRRSGSTLANQ